MLECVENSIKVIVVGDGNVGKTSMLRRFVKGEFVNQYKKTIGAEFMEKNVFLHQSNTTVKLMLWDTAGQEVFNSLTQAYYRGAGAAILAFSTVDKHSFMNVVNWKRNVENVCGIIPMVLCQTKFDLAHDAAITNEEAEQLAIELQLPFFRVSTKDDFNVTQLFEYTAGMCLSEEPGENRSAPLEASSQLSRNKVPGAMATRPGTQSMMRVDLRASKPGDKKKKKKLCTLI
ncbi:small G-protein [Trypanosoma conorhini]|uniref:Small G-protein n=1 Tax=Trypanosoma conorhini TaxID=83891 RepID=A0A422P2F5_9TRYP|nr:small G-protein [Trypanosoma conorhini]RNF11892.1 small G-protein [Trypanosoma conorhini]